MKKKQLLALLMALAMLVCIMAACGDSNSTESTAPVTESEEVGGEDETPEYVGVRLTYDEDRGDFVTHWYLTLNADGSFYLTEYNEMSGGQDDYAGSSWTDNGDGTVTTGAWDADGSISKSDFFESDGTCTWIIDGTTITPANAGDSDEGGDEASVNPGKYTYVDGDTTWVVMIMGNGSCTVSEYETASYTGENDDGLVVSHACREYDDGNCWVDNGDGTFETGEWEPEERDDNHPSEDYTSPNGVTVWKVVDAEEGTIEPTEKVEEFSYYGALTYGSYSEETGENWVIMIMGNGDCTIQLWDEEGHRVSEYVPRGFRVDDATHFTVFAFEDDAELPPFLEENAMTQWEIVDGENMIVEYIGILEG